MKIIHPYNFDLPAVMKKRREELRMTQDEVAKKIGITSMGLSHFEVGTRIPRIDILESWAVALKLEVKITFDIIP